MAEVPFQCPSCATRLKATEALVARGANITCPRCKTLVSLAGLAPAEEVRTVEPDHEPEPAPRPNKKKKKRPAPRRRAGSGSGSIVMILMIVLGVAGIGGLVALGIWLLPGLFASPHERALSQVVTSMEGIADAFDRVSNRASAEKEAPIIRKLVTNMTSAFEQLRSLGEPGAKEKEKLRQEFEPRMKAATDRFQSVLRLMLNPEIAEVLGPVLTETAQKMQQGGMGADRGGFGGVGMPPLGAPPRRGR